MCFPSMPSRIGGADLADLDALARSRMAEATALPDHGRVRFRKTGEHHAYNPLGVRTAQKAAAGADRDQFHEWLRMSHMDRPQSLRELLVLRESASPARLDEVEPASEIVKRFVSTAMSLGALSPEAHEALALAMNQRAGRIRTRTTVPPFAGTTASSRSRPRDSASRPHTSSAPTSSRSRSRRARSPARAASCRV